MKSWLRGALQLLTLCTVTLATAVVVHRRDNAQETRDIKALVAKYDDLGNANLLAAYVGNTTISQAMMAGRSGAVQCEADLRASSQYGLLKACLANSPCAAGIIDIARTEAPELLTDRPPPFRRYKGGELCSPNGDRRAG